MKKTIAFICVIIIYSCGKGDIDGSTLSDAFLENKSSHNIEIRPYWGGSVNQNMEIFLHPGDSKQIAHDFVTGKLSLGSGFFSEYFIADSFEIIYDNIYSVSHYYDTPALKPIKYCLFNSPRNIVTIGNWQGKVVKESKYSQHNVYTYTFTEQDYLDAK